MPWTEVMSKWKHGQLHSGGPRGPAVHNRQQAIAILMSEKRKAAAGHREYQDTHSYDPHAHVRAELKRRSG